MLSSEDFIKLVSEDYPKKTKIALAFFEENSWKDYNEFKLWFRNMFIWSK